MITIIVIGFHCSYAERYKLSVTAGYSFPGGLLARQPVLGKPANIFIQEACPVVSRRLNTRERLFLKSSLSSY
jgi:hypothetical protein